MPERIRTKTPSILDRIRLWAWLYQGYLIVPKIILVVLIVVPPMMLWQFKDGFVVTVDGASSSASILDELSGKIVGRYESDIFHHHTYNRIKNAADSSAQSPDQLKRHLKAILDSHDQMRTAAIVDRSGKPLAVVSRNHTSPVSVDQTLTKQFWSKGGKTIRGPMYNIRAVPHISIIYPLNNRICLYTQHVLSENLDLAFRLLPGNFHMALLDRHGEICIMRTPQDPREPNVPLDSQTVRIIRDAPGSGIVQRDDTSLKTKYDICFAPVNALDAKLVIGQKKTRHTLIVTLLILVSGLGIIGLKLLGQKAKGQQMRDQIRNHLNLFK
jgi:hypothetical protein